MKKNFTPIFLMILPALLFIMIQTIFFHQFEIERTSIVKSERSKNRFLNVVYKGELILYRDIDMNRKIGMQSTSNTLRYDSGAFNYYLYSELNGLKSVGPTESIKTVKDLLVEYNVNPEFLNQLDDKVRFKDILDILELYDTWICNR